MAEYLVIQTINSAEYGGGPVIEEMKGQNLSDIQRQLSSRLTLYDGDDIDIFRITSHKNLKVRIQEVTSIQ